MKNTIKQCQHQRAQAFTLLEMLLVLIVISVLMLLFIPNLSKHKEHVTDSGNRAVVKIVENQAELFELSQGTKAKLSQLVGNGHLTQNQVDAYHAYYKKHSSETPQIKN
ncbi:competence type IV pilus major pilin ComGC [Streptococcus catagoni]|uniref:competence type IV pilus major pilin ComGC n=1 Tax=Streptococcus catagoni TaxID=2654874 RepID=UPI0014072D70|nr:competence type IV pilus major pilin ComGC [Streptococcus catagoni]